MMSWRDLFAYLWSRHDCGGPENTDALFAANLASQTRAQQAADGVRLATDALRGRLEVQRAQIRRRIEETAAARSSPPTSEARAQVDALMKRMVDRDTK